MKRKQAAQVVDIARARGVERELRGQRVGRLIEWSNDRGPMVDYPGNPHGPLAARTIVPLDAARVARAVAEARGVLLAFDGEVSDKPIIVGLLEPQPGTPAALLASGEALIDGRRVVLEGKDEIVLRCGAASITLRRNGRLVVRGAYVETRAEGVNRIKGGSVKIN